LIVLPIIGSYSPPEELLFVGPVTRFIRRYLNWFSVDMLVTFAAISFTHLVWELVGPLAVTWKVGLAHAVVFSFLFSTTGLFLRVNLTRWSKATPADFARLIPAWLIALGCATLLNKWLQIYPSILIFAASALSLFGFTLVRFNSRFAVFFLSRLARYVRAEVATERVLIVGSGRTAESVSWVLNHPTYSNKFRIVGYVDNNIFAHGMRAYGANILGSYSDIPELLGKHDIGVVIFADNRIALKDFRTITEICNGKSIRLVVIPDVFGAMNNLMAIPSLSLVSRPEEQVLPIHSSAIADGQVSPCHFCAGRYTRLEMEAQIEKTRGLPDVKK
jgi:FlaA1/EpsC-like NDP-sugar epimerase